MTTAPLPATRDKENGKPLAQPLAHGAARISFFVPAAIFCVAVPGFASLKALIIFALWILLLVQSRFQLRSGLWFLSVLLNLLACSEVALLHAVPTADMFNQLSRLLLFFLVLGIGMFTVQSKRVDKRRLDSLILSIATFSASLKIAVLAAIFSGWYSLEAIEKVFGFETVTLDIGLGLQRLQFPSDVILIFLISCYAGGRRKVVDLLLLIAVTVSVVLSFSRYLFAAYFLCLILRAFRLRKFDIVAKAGIVVATLLVLILSVSLVSRFAGAGSAASDQTRTEQIQQLANVISQHLFLGTGIGSSVNGYRRSEAIPFSYEVQWYAMTMQFGALGLFWFITNLISPLISTLWAGKGKLFFLLVFAAWVVGGFTNPLITSLGSAFGLCILMLRLTQDSETHPLQADAPR